MIYIASLADDAELVQHQAQEQQQLLLDASICSRPGSQTATTWSYSPKVMRPSSPALTNPDMILPYDGHVSRVSTPSPPPQTMRHFTPQSSDSSTLGWNQPENRHFSLRTRPTSHVYGQDEKSLGTVNMDIGAKNHGSRVDTPDGSSAYNEPETYSRPLLRVESKKEGNPYYMDGFLMPGTLGDYHLDPGYRSSGTVFELDEDLKSVREDGPLGGNRDHDEEDQDHRVRLSSIYDRAESPSGLLLDEEDEDDQSSATLSKQAERILASAKRKLDKMEGNLSRARHSLITSPTPSPLSSLNTSPHSSTRRRSPSTGNQYMRLQNPASRTGLESNHDLQFYPSTSSSMLSHSRIMGETSVPISTYRRQESDQIDQDDVHTSSPYDRASHFEPHMGHRTSKNADGADDGNLMAQSTRPNPHQRQAGPRDYFNPFRIHNRSSPTSLSVALKPVNERDISSTVNLSMDGISVVGNYASSNPQAFTTSNQYSQGLTRSRSAMPIREVRDQMEDLKGRISDLQQRAKADNFKRRSLQSLRTDSPFTAAEQWYRGVDEGKGDYVRDGAGTETGGNEKWKPISGPNEPDIVRANGEESDHARNGQTESATLFDGPKDTSIGKENDTIPEDTLADNISGNQGTTENNYTIEYMPETNEELEENQDSEAGTTEDEAEYYEAPVSIGERHEDRADAFDYEHFFLYSALGNYSRGDTSRRDSYISNDSTTSVETARPEPEQSKDETQRLKGRPQMWIHGGTVSTESLVTVATFATAMEDDGGEESDGDEVKLGKHTPVMALPGSFPDMLVDTLALKDGDGWNNRNEYIQEQDISTDDGSNKVIGSIPSSRESWPLPDSNEPSDEHESLSLLLSVLHISPASLRLSRQAASIPTLATEDTALVERVLGNLGKVCTHLQEVLNDPTRDDQERHHFRTRLAEASRILEGN